MALTLSRGRTSVRAGRLVITCKSGPHASALRLKIYKVSAIGLYAWGAVQLSVKEKAGKSGHTPANTGGDADSAIIRPVAD